MYSDLDKKSRGGFIIEDALDLNEVFDTALNVRKGQIFYGRGYGLDFEQYLLKLNEPDTILSLQDELFSLRNLDGRLVVDPSKTKLYTDTEKYQSLIIQAMLDIQGLPQVPVSGMISDDNENYPTLEELLGNSESPWTESEDNVTLGTRLTSETNTKIKLANGKTLNIVNGKLNSIS